MKSGLDVRDWFLSPLQWLHIAVTATLFGVVLGLVTGCARADSDSAVPPWLLPRFDGSAEARTQPPGGVLKRPHLPDSRELFDLVVSCFPTPSWWQPEVALETRYSQAQRSAASLVAPAEATTYAGVVARIPLYSYGEIDRERQRELERRNQTAQTVGKLYQRLADLEIARRTRALAVSIEARSGRRVAAGVADTGEQIAAIKAVADAETSVISANADLIAARLTLIGMCRSRHDVDALLDRLGVPK